VPDCRDLQSRFEPFVDLSTKDLDLGLACEHPLTTIAAQTLTLPFKDL